MDRPLLCGEGLAGENEQLVENAAPARARDTHPFRQVGEQLLHHVRGDSPLSAEDAEKVGLVNRIVSSEELQEATLELAKQIVEASTQTVSIGKEAFYRQVQMDRREAYDYASEVMVKNVLTEDAEEGISAFLGKREPKWKN